MQTPSPNAIADNFAIKRNQTLGRRLRFVPQSSNGLCVNEGSDRAQVGALMVARCRGRSAEMREGPAYRFPFAHDVLIIRRPPRSVVAEF